MFTFQVLKLLPLNCSCRDPCWTVLYVRLNAAATGHLHDTSFVPELLMLFSCWLCARPLDFGDIFDVIYTHFYYELTMLCLRVFWVSTTPAWSPPWWRPQTLERCAAGYRRCLHERTTIAIFDMHFNEDSCQNFYYYYDVTPCWVDGDVSRLMMFWTRRSQPMNLFYALLSTCETRQEDTTHPERLRYESFRWKPGTSELCGLQLTWYLVTPKDEYFGQRMWNLTGDRAS